jgi:hypothetical protein
MSKFTKLAEHFEQYCYEYPAVTRGEYAVKIASIDPAHAAEYKRLASYSGQIPRPFEKISGLEAREGYVSDEGKEVLHQLQKLAHQMTPYELEAVLTEFDTTFKLAQYNYYPNPHETVFYPLGVKIAERWTGGTETVTSEDLDKYLASENAYHIEARFSKELLEGMKQDAWPVFLSLPEPSKTIIARLVNGHKISNERI